MSNKDITNQRLMTFTDIDSSILEPSVEQKFNYDFSKKYIAGKNVLDVGCWTGLYEMLAYKQVSKFTAVDVEEKALKVLKKNLPQVECMRAFSHILPFPDKNFDVVTFWAVIEHIPIGYELASILEMKRVLKPGGYLFLTTMNKSLFSDLLDPAYWLVGHRHYKKENLIKMLSDAGFKVEDVRIHGSFLSSFNVISFYISKYIFKNKLPRIKFFENEIIKNYYKSGFFEVAIRAKVMGKVDKEGIKRE
jgi:ubiquinone/menaquinone biosynthesis C-methylase UbiE